jgi:hypothetical protein
MVAFSGADPIGVLVGAKRPSGTLVHTIAVHPDHRRQGHGRHLLASLGSKLAILGPPRIIAEVPETLAPACELFSASGYVQEALLTDYVLDRPALSERGNAARVEGFVIPVTVDDLAANGLLGEADPQVCWERSVETLTARKDDIAGLAVASDERIEAYLLYVKPGVGPPTFAGSYHRELRRDLAGALAEAGPEGNAEACPRAGPPPTEIVSLRTLIEDGGARLKQLLSQLRARGMKTFRFPKVHPEEFSREILETLGFHPVGGHFLYVATLQPFEKLRGAPSNVEGRQRSGAS